MWQQEAHHQRHINSNNLKTGWRQYKYERAINDESFQTMLVVHLFYSSKHDQRLVVQDPQNQAPNPQLPSLVWISVRCRWWNRIIKYFLLFIKIIYTSYYSSNSDSLFFFITVLNLNIHKIFIIFVNMCEQACWLMYL